MSDVCPYKKRSYKPEANFTSLSTNVIGHRSTVCNSHLGHADQLLYIRCMERTEISLGDALHYTVQKSAEVQDLLYCRAALLFLFTVGLQYTVLL